MKLYNQIVAGMLVGVMAGLAAHTLAADSGWIDWFTRYLAQPVGDVFLRLLLMTVVALVFASVTLGVARFGDVGRLGRVGGLTLGYFLLSTTLSVVLGLTLVNLAEPGAALDPSIRQQFLDTFGGRVESLLPAAGHDGGPGHGRRAAGGHRHHPGRGSAARHVSHHGQRGR